MASRNVKKRNWAFILYPESAPSDWKDVLQLSGLQVAVSPLHDKDLNPDGELKKPHHHVIVCYSGPTSYNVVKSLTDKLNCPVPQPLEQVRGYYRYFTHKDNPEKYQYSELDIETINGFSIRDFTELTKSEVLVIKKQIQAFIRDNGIMEYSILMDALQDMANDDWYDVASSHTYFFDKYIASKRNRFFNSGGDFYN